MWRFGLLFFAALSFFVGSLRAQYHNAWFRATATYSINEKIKTDVELQHRRQSGWGNNNLLEKNLMFTMRNWVHYQHNKKLRFSVNPFTWFSHYRVIESEADEKRQPNREYRATVAFDWQNDLTQSLGIYNRSAAEYRIFMAHMQPITRVRHRIGLRYNVNSHLKLSVYDELFVNVAGVERNHFYDHNRMGSTIEYRISRIFKLEAGYIFADRLLTYHSYILKEHNFYLNLILEL